MGEGKRKNFIYLNEEFKCENCGFENSPSNGEIRNHCMKCLYSKHLDLDVPGDRKNGCKGLMMPISVFYKPAKGYMIQHECVDCGGRGVNKSASDDNQDLIVTLSTYGHRED